MGNENPICTIGDYSKPSHEGCKNTIELLVGNNVALLEDLSLYENKSWNDPRDFAKLVKAIALPQDVPSTSDRRLIELENRVQCLMEAYIASTQPTQVNKVTTPCEICSGPHDTQYCMKDPEQAFVEYASSRTDEASGKWYTFKPEQNNLGDTYNPSWRNHPNLREANMSQENLLQTRMGIEPQQPKEPEPTLKDEFQDLHLNLPVLEFLDHAPIYNTILDKYVKRLKLGKNESAFVQGEIPAKMEDPGLFTLPCRLGDSKPFDTLVYLGSCVNIIPLYLFKKLNIGLLEETDHIFGLADRCRRTNLLLRKEGLVRLPFTKEWEIARDVELNPFKDTLVFMRMVEFLGAIPINLKSNVWESEELIKNMINWDKPLKNEDGTWHAKIRLIDPDGEEFTKTL
uniref:Gag-Asp_proteas domain-containing protein n=1 Tax=Tanacetum cinerariifolium TaxID=118510 RepID=A0A6L2MR45_TANCI|nr:Gag-Asp_proteas domain-containing protein [Tanacetum cinerariifolium]